MEIMNTRRMMAIGLAGLLALSAQSCLKSYVEYFDDSSASRLSTYLSDLDAMLGGEQYGWRMEYFVGNEDGDFGGINVALKFDNEKGEVTAMSEEEKEGAYTSLYVLTTDSGPVLSFDTYNPVLHKYGTASAEYYEGRGGDYQFFIIGYDNGIGFSRHVYPPSVSVPDYTGDIRFCKERRPGRQPTGSSPE